MITAVIITCYPQESALKNLEKIMMQSSTNNQNLQGWSLDLIFLKSSKCDSEIPPGIENYWIRGKGAKIIFEASQC